MSSALLKPIPASCLDHSGQFKLISSPCINGWFFFEFKNNGNSKEYSYVFYKEGKFSQLYQTFSGLHGSTLNRLYKFIPGTRIPHSLNSGAAMYFTHPLSWDGENLIEDPSLLRGQDFFIEGIFIDKDDFEHHPLVIENKNARILKNKMNNLFGEGT